MGEGERRRMGERLRYRKSKVRREIHWKNEREGDRDSERER